MGQERRRHPRIASHHLTTVFLPAPAGVGREEVVGRTLDLSQGGVLLETAGGLDEGLTVTVSIAVEDRLLEVEGFIIRVRPVGEGFYEVAISFGPVNAATLGQIEAIRARLMGPTA